MRLDGGVGWRRFHPLETIVRAVPPGNESPGYMQNPAEAGWRRLGVVLSFLAVAVLAVMPSIAVAAEMPTWWADAVREGEQKGYQVITLEELATLSKTKDNLLLIDARTAYEYRAGHIPGAVNLEFHPGDKLQFSREKRARLKELIGPDKDRPVVIYCRSFR